VPALPALADYGHYLTAAVDVDHIIPFHDNFLLFIAENNLMPLCKRHHGEKCRCEKDGVQWIAAGVETTVENDDERYY
jgi:hypothetical protein